MVLAEEELGADPMQDHCCKAQKEAAARREQGFATAREQARQALKKMFVKLVAQKISIY